MNVPAWPCPECLQLNHAATTTCDRCGETIPTTWGDDA